MPKLTTNYFCTVNKSEMLMRFLKYLLVFFFILALTKTLAAQNAAISLTDAVKTEVVDSLSSGLLKKYVFPDTAVKMSSRIRQRLNSGAYKALHTPADFSQALQADLDAVYRDLHMRIYYDAGFGRALQTKSYMERVTRRIQFLKMARQQNFGFIKTGILDGNIGYITLTRFFDVNAESIIAVKSAFDFLRNTNALIIDVRDNRGGEPDMVKYICGYFFDTKTRLNDYYEWQTHKTLHYYTEPMADSSAFVQMPLYILINNHTGSAAEEFSYDLQSLGRATIVGQTSAGAAHWASGNSISNGFVANIPYMRAVNPVTHTNWEKVGVKPDIICDADKALTTAQLHIYDIWLKTAKDTDVIKSAKWFRPTFASKLYPFKITTSIIVAVVGNYNGRLITFEKGRLYFTDVNGYKIELNCLSATDFSFVSDEHHIEFYKDKAGKVKWMNFIYQDGHSDTFLKKY